MTKTADDLEAQLQAIANGGLVEKPSELYYPPRLENTRPAGGRGISVFEPGAPDPFAAYIECENPVEVRQ